MKTRNTTKTNSSRSRSTKTRRSGNGQESNGRENSELHELFLDELADIHNAEQQLVKALPKMAKAAQSDELREAFEAHLDETEGQIQRLEQVAEALDESIKRKVCKAMQGLLAEGQEMMQENKGSPALDAALIAAAQKVEHYEIATYGTLCAWAERMGQQEAVELLRQNESEEEAADEKLTGIAESLANEEAASG